MGNAYGTNIITAWTVVQAVI